MEKMEYSHICVPAIASVTVTGEEPFTDDDLVLFAEACGERANGTPTFTQANNPIWVEYHKKWLNTVKRVAEESYARGRAEAKGPFKKVARKRTRTRTARKKVTKKKKR